LSSQLTPYPQHDRFVNESGRMSQPGDRGPKSTISRETIMTKQLGSVHEGSVQVGEYSFRGNRYKAHKDQKQIILEQGSNVFGGRIEVKYGNADVGNFSRANSSAMVTDVRQEGSIYKTHTTTETGSVRQGSFHMVTGGSGSIFQGEHRFERQNIVRAGSNVYQGSWVGQAEPSEREFWGPGEE